jgi:hypothetical protein
MKLKLDRIISLATLLASIVAILLVVKRPAPVAPSQGPVLATPSGQSADPPASHVPQGEQASPSWTSSASTPMVTSGTSQASTQAAASPKSDSRSTSDAISGALAKMLGGGASAVLAPDSNVGSGEPVIKDQQVSMDGDIVHGKFLTEIAGKDVWVTISGHMGEKDGYATFDPTEIKVGNTNVPVALVNPALQRKMAEERDRLKIPSSGAPQ